MTHDDEMRKMIATDGLSWQKGHWTHPEMQGTILDLIPSHIQPLCEIVEKSDVYKESTPRNPVHIYDIGGGTGDVANAIRTRLPSSHVHVIDVDSKKFPEKAQTGVSFHAADCSKHWQLDRLQLPRPQGLICRYVLHHLEPKTQEHIIDLFSECYKKVPFSVTDVCFEDSGERDRMQKIFDWIAAETGTNRRYWLTEAETKEMFHQKRDLARSGPRWQFQRDITLWNSTPQEYCPDGFIKGRFNLSDAQVWQVSRMMENRPLQAIIYTALLHSEERNVEPFSPF